MIHNWRKDVSITQAEVANIIKDHARTEGDTGSPEVQVSIFTAKIKRLTEHFKQHKQDKHSYVGLIRMINKRRSLLDYLKSVDQGRYADLIQKLGLRR